VSAQGGKNKKKRKVFLRTRHESEKMCMEKEKWQLLDVFVNSFCVALQ
jgi:hypothetical protein